MTPAEAREIDRQEFKAECAAVRQRAYAYAAEYHYKQCNKVANWLGREVPAVVFNAPIRGNRIYRPPKMHEAFGRSQSLAQWANEYRINIGTVRTRLKLGWTLENALTRAVQDHRRPGVVSDLQASKGTGGGSLPQAKNPEYNFSGIEA